MAAARPYRGARPCTQRMEGGFTRANYADWVRGFRARWSDRTLAIRPQTYRLLFKKAIGMREPRVIASEVGKVVGTKEEGASTEEVTHAEAP